MSDMPYVYAPVEDTPTPPEIPPTSPPQAPESVTPPLPYPGDGLDAAG